MEERKSGIQFEKLALHYKYLVGITLVIVSICIGWSLVDKTEVVNSLSNASVLLSIVLAVIAILISLWDVAGQKGALVDVKVQVDQLKKYVEEINGTFNQSKEILNKLENFDSKFSIDFEPFYKEIEEIKEYMQSNGSSSSNDEVLENINKIEQLIETKMLQAEVISEMKNKNSRRVADELVLIKWMKFVLEKKKSAMCFQTKICMKNLLREYPQNNFTIIELQNKF